VNCTCNPAPGHALWCAANAPNARWEDVYGGVRPHDASGMTLFHLCVYEDGDKYGVSYLEITSHLANNPHIYGWRLDDMVHDLDRELTRIQKEK
jgi:hypothetical protein